MLFYPVKYHPPTTASSVIRVIRGYQDIVRRKRLVYALIGKADLRTLANISLPFSV